MKNTVVLSNDQLDHGLRAMASTGQDSPTAGMGIRSLPQAGSINVNLQCLKPVKYYFAKRCFACLRSIGQQLREPSVIFVILIDQPLITVKTGATLRRRQELCLSS